ncbi:MAG: DHH family phosphoesterase [Nitrososphaeria archaeon]
MYPNDFKDKALKAIEHLSNFKDIFIIHHDDADGLASAAILKMAFERKKFNVRLVCLEKLFPIVVELLHKNDVPIIYADLGSPHADLISLKNVKGNTVVILDHHDPVPFSNPSVFDLNLEHFGFKGETDFSGSTISYLFSIILDKNNFDLSYLAVVGSREIPGGFVGLNAQVLETALKNSILKKNKDLEIMKLNLSVDKLFSALQIFGSVGYYRNGPNVGVKVALKGFSEEEKRFLEMLENERKEANKKLLAILYKYGLKETKYVQYFDSKNMFKGMGSKVLGSFCSYISYQKKLIKLDKYILGYMDILGEIPGFGRLSERLVKVSVRVPEGLKKAIEGDKMPSAIDVLAVAEEVGGFSDGHEFAASCVVPKESFEEFISSLDKFIDDWVNGVRKVKRKRIVLD